MSGPWEKFQAAQPTGNEGPWNKFAQAPAKPEEPGWFQQIDNFVRTAANGATFGLTDKLAAMMSSGNYDDNIKKERSQSKRAESELGAMSLPAELAGGIAGALATGGGSLVARGASTAGKIGYGALEGAGYGAANAIGHTDDGNYMKSVPEGALIGGAIGGALPIATKAAGKVISPLAERLSELTTQEKANRALAEKLGIPLTAGMETNSPNLKRAESVASQIPLGNIFGGGTEESARKFREAVAQRFGLAGSDLSPEILANAKSAMGKEYDAIAGRNTLNDQGDHFLTDMFNIMNDAGRNLRPEDAKYIQQQIQQHYNQFAQEFGGQMPGANYQNIRKWLNKEIDRDPTSATAEYFGRMKSAYDNMMERSVSQADAAAWKDLNKRYSHFKVVQDAMGGAGNAATGNLSPLQFARAVERHNGRDQFALGKGTYGDLGLLADDIFRGVPDSGTAGRNFMTKLMEGGGLAGLGVGGGAAAGGIAAGATGALAGAAAPIAAANALNSKPVQKYLSNQFLTKQREEALRELLQKYGPSGLLAMGY